MITSLWSIIFKHGNHPCWNIKAFYAWHNQEKWEYNVRCFLLKSIDNIWICYLFCCRMDVTDSIINDETAAWLSGAPKSYKKWNAVIPWLPTIFHLVRNSHFLVSPCPNNPQISIMVFRKWLEKTQSIQFESTWVSQVLSLARWVNWVEAKTCYHSEFLLTVKFLLNWFGSAGPNLVYEQWVNVIMIMLGK